MAERVIGADAERRRSDDREKTHDRKCDQRKDHKCEYAFGTIDGYGRFWFSVVVCHIPKDTRHRNARRLMG